MGNTYFVSGCTPAPLQRKMLTTEELTFVHSLAVIYLSLCSLPSVMDILDLSVRVGGEIHSISVLEDDRNWFML